MTFEEMLKDLQNNGFKIIKKEKEARIIKNKKAITYTESEWDSLGTKARIIELNAIYQTFK